MMSKINLLLIWLAKGTLCQQSRPVCVQGFKSVPNTFLMLFGGRITSSLMAPLLPSGGMHRQTRFCAILLAGLLGLVLAGCAGSSKDAASGGNPLAVTDVQSIVGDTNILLGWTNPNRDNITGFQITSQVVVNGSVDNETLVERLFTENIEERSLTDGPGFSINKSARVTYNITGLAEDTEYEVVIGVIYNEDTSDPQNLRLARMTTGDITTGIGNDFDRDGKKNREDDCPSGLTGTANATEDIDNDGCRNSEDPDTDGDGVLNDVDEFPLDACASVDADNDGRPGYSGCRLHDNLDGR